VPAQRNPLKFFLTPYPHLLHRVSDVVAHLSQLVRLATGSAPPQTGRSECRAVIQQACSAADLPPVGFELQRYCFLACTALGSFRTARLSGASCDGTAENPSFIPTQHGRSAARQHR